MRIAYMLTSLGIGGAEKQVIAIGERMASRGHDVVLIVLRSAEDHEWPTSLPVHRLGMKKSIPGILAGLNRACGVLRSFKPDLLHSHTLPANITARLLRAIGAVPPVISTIHNVYEGGWHRTLAYRITDSLCMHTTAVSRAAADRYVRIKAVAPDKCSVITNGIDTANFSPDPSVEVLSRPHGEFTWLAAGRDVPAKDFDNLLAAFEVVRTVLPHAQLHIAGQPAPGRSYRTDLESKCVHWLGVSDDMPATIAACDAFVLSSAWEGLPLVIGEAMAMEKPVVATDVGGVHEILGDVGVLVPPKDAQALADAMLRIMRLPKDEQLKIGRAGRDRIVAHFDIDAKVNEWETLYRALLARPDESAISIRSVEN